MVWLLEVGTSCVLMVAATPLSAAEARLAATSLHPTQVQELVESTRTEMITTFHATAAHAARRSAAGISQPQPHSRTLAPQHTLCTPHHHCQLLKLSHQLQHRPLAPQWPLQHQLQHRHHPLAPQWPLQLQEALQHRLQPLGNVATGLLLVSSTPPHAQPVTQ